MAAPSFSPYAARGRSCWQHAGTAGHRLQRTTGLPASSAPFTACGWAVHRVNSSNFTTLCYFENASLVEFFGLATDGAGSQLQIWSDNAGTNLATLVIGRPFFWAYTKASGAGPIGYYRTLIERTFTSAQAVNTTDFTPAELTICNGQFDEFFNGAVWNVRAWTRVLTARELMLESLSSMPVERRDLYAWWPIEGSFLDLIRDHGGNNRHLTRTGGLVQPWFLPAYLLNPLPQDGVGIAAGGQVFNQSASGSLAATGTVIRQTNKIVAGATTAVGTILRLTSKTVSGAITSVGVLVRLTLKIVAGAITASGALTAFRVILATVGGALTVAGTLIIQVTFARAVAGTLTATGTLLRTTLKAVGGAVAAAGQLVRSTAKTVVGTITASGILATAATLLQSVAGSLTAFGSVARQFIPGGGAMAAVKRLFSFIFGFRLR